MSHREANNLSRHRTESTIPIARPVSGSDPHAVPVEVEVAASELGYERVVAGIDSAGGNSSAALRQASTSQQKGPLRRRSQLLRIGGSWGFSLLTHLGAMLLLGFLFLPELPALDLPNLKAKVAQLPDEELVPVVELQPEELDLQEEMTFEEQPETALVESELSFVPAQDFEAMAAPEVEVLDLGSELAPLLTAVDALGSGGSGFAGRGHMARIAMVRKGGGTPASEAAVSSALKWLTEHQNPDGSWSFDHRRFRCQGRCNGAGSLDTSFAGATAMALLPFLGAGQTHLTGDYQQVVGNGLDALLRQMKVQKQGGSFEDGGMMYSHGLAAIALCEAYGMTDDPRLQQPAQAALNYIVYAQDPQGGGWRYTPRTPGDTSVVGWQVMALKSGHMSYLNVPYSTVRGATYFLDNVQVEGGTGYAYVVNELNYRKGTSAIGLLCRMYLGWKRDHQILQQGVARIAKAGPSEVDFYYNYYAAQLLFQYTNAEGELWEAWNNKLRDFLVASQEKQGHAKGSWLVADPHGKDKGGRLFCTSLGTMTLEVYYRHMPLYRSESVEAEFPE